MSRQLSKPHQRAQSVLLPPSGIIHLWSAELDVPGDEAQAFQLLAADERHRALQFRFDRDRRRFTIARAALRAVLAQYGSHKPNEIVLRYGPYGKPALACGEPQFNLSHSGDLAVIAVCADAPLGVDIEQLNRPMDSMELIRSFASANEQAAFAALSQEHHARAFLRWWTRKEAVLKALGTGHALPMDSFDVSILPDNAGGAEVRSAAFRQSLSLQNIPLAAGYIGSLAACGAVHSIETRHAGRLASIPVA